MVFPFVAASILASAFIGAGASYSYQKKNREYQKKDRMAGYESERNLLKSEVSTTADTLKAKMIGQAALSNLYPTGVDAVTQWAEGQRNRIEQNYYNRVGSITGKRYLNIAKQGTQRVIANRQKKSTPPKFPSLG